VTAPTHSPAARARAVLRFTVRYVPWLAWQLVVSVVRLALDVGTPGSTQRPRIVKLDMAGLTDLEVALLTSSITITPGTLVLAIAPDDELGDRAAYVQGLFGEDEEQLVSGLEDMRAHVLSATRGRAEA
jgi:multicomponent Na+:H+ antiporter subunit E